MLNTEEVKVQIEIMGAQVPLETNHSGMDSGHIEGGALSTVLLALDVGFAYQLGLGAERVSYFDLYAKLRERPKQTLTFPLEHFMDELLEVAEGSCFAAGKQLVYGYAKAYRRNLIAGSPMLFVESKATQTTAAVPQRRIGAEGLPVVVTWDHRDLAMQGRSVEPTKEGVRIEPLQLGFALSYDNQSTKPEVVKGLFDWVPVIRQFETLTGQQRNDFLEDFLMEPLSILIAEAKRQGVTFNTATVFADRTAFSRGTTRISLIHEARVP